MPRASEIYTVLEARRIDLGLSQAEVGRMAFGKSDNSALQALRRGSSPSVEKLEMLCFALGLEFYFGPPRETGPVASIEIDSDDYAAIPRYDVQLAAGDGHLNTEGSPVEHLAFSRRWLRQLNVTPDKACLLSVQGKSMQPNLHDGDLVLIDQRRREIRNDRVYAFNDGDRGSRIKRLELIPDQLVVIRSDNSGSNPPELRAGEAMNRLAEGIIGEVVWSCHSWGWTNTGHSLNQI